MTRTVVCFHNLLSLIVQISKQNTPTDWLVHSCLRAYQQAIQGKVKLLKTLDNAARVHCIGAVPRLASDSTPWRQARRGRPKAEGAQARHTPPLRV